MPRNLGQVDHLAQVALEQDFSGVIVSILFLVSI